jgi:hypothetical protein
MKVSTAQSDHCLAGERRSAGSITAATAKRFFLMAKSDRSVLLSSAVLVIIPALAHSGELTKGDHAAFAIKPEGRRGDVKTRLWSGVNVAAVTPDLSIRCDESSSCYPWKIEIVSTVFWIGETGNGPTNRRSAWETNWVSDYGGVDDPVRRRGYGPAGFRPLENPFYVRCRTVIWVQVS